MSLGDKVFGWIKETLASVRHGEVICARCVRPGDGASPGTFGDYAICPRCGESVTSQTKAFLVEHLPVSSCDPVRLAYRCAVCRQVVTDGDMLLDKHRCSRAAIDEILGAGASARA